ncbi:fatty-acyl-CoA synthase [Rhodococcus sp. 27YEA15]|uniref:class I adenylate-forming enzyme family protein n=1 Tax=Rhodococcus sp. 27YEA15 TaxID=3156259 RepID=UPI003C79935C
MSSVFALGIAESSGHALTVDGLLRRAGEVDPATVAIVDGEQRISFAQLGEAANRFASGLADLGVSPGDRVAIWAPNCIEWVVSFFGAVRVGAVVVPLNTGLMSDEVTYQIGQSGATVLIAATDHHSRNLALEAIAGLSEVPGATVISIGATVPEGTIAWEKVAEATGPGLDHVPSPDDPLMMLYTSGTTGAPKGAVHTHRCLESLLTAVKRMQLTERDCVVLYLPLFHVYGLMAGLIMMTAARARIVLMGQFDSTKSLELMESEKASIVYGIPTTYIDQLGHPGIADRDLSAVRLSITPFPRDLVDRVSTRFGKCLNTFGMTETASMAFLPALDDPEEIAVGTVGRPLDGLEVRIVDPVTGDQVAEGVAGSLQLRGPQVLSHYHERPDATEAAFGADGWFKTGDIARLDAGGNLTFVGRSGDHFKVGGEFVDPVDVEAALQSHPAVERAAVLGVPDDRLGSVAHAWVKLRAGTGVDSTDALSEELREHARDRLAFFKRPRSIHFVSELPVTASGKVQKFRLKETLPR